MFDIIVLYLHKLIGKCLCLLADDEKQADRGGSPESWFFQSEKNESEVDGPYGLAKKRTSSNVVETKTLAIDSLKVRAWQHTFHPYCARVSFSGLPLLLVSKTPFPTIPLVVIAVLRLFGRRL